jgi:hypothetical protein
MSRRVLATVTAGGIRHPRYVNGRILAARDLHAGQTAVAQHALLSARANGHGVVEGLEVAVVSETAPGSAVRLAVSPGYAFAPGGELIRLAVPAEFPLATGSHEVHVAGDFHGAEPGVMQVSILVAGAVLVPGTDPGSVPGELVTARVEGVQFRLIAVPVPAPLTGVNVAPSNLQNLLAHCCFGTPDRLSAGGNPLAFGCGFGILDGLQRQGLVTEQEVALALICSDQSQLLFSDMWAVRRRYCPPGGTMAGPLSSLRGQAVEAEAVYLQFDCQVQAAVKSGDQSTVSAAEAFCYLPPAGCLPSGPGGYSALDFFQGMPVTMAAKPPGPAALLEAVLSEQPIDVSAPPLLELWLLEQPPAILFRRARFGTEG